MGYGMPFLTVTSIRQQKSDNQFKMTQIMHQLQKMSMETSEVSSQYYNQMTQALHGQDGEVDYIEWDDSFLNTAYESQIAVINAQEKKLNAEKAQLESKDKELSQMEESFNKLVEQGIKEASIGAGSGS